MDYKINYSKRKSIGLKIKHGELFVYAPFTTDIKTIEQLIYKHREWIEKNIAKSLSRDERFPELTPDEILRLKKEAKNYFQEKTRQFAAIMGLKYGRITITSAKTRFGSCSSKKNLCFSYRLMQYPEPAREYVVVHELSHLVHMNHSSNFYKLIQKYMPDYKERRRLLK